MKRSYIAGFLGVAVLLFVVGCVALWVSFVLLSGLLRLAFTILGVIGLVGGISEFFLYLYHRRRKQTIPKEARSEESMETWMRR